MRVLLAGGGTAGHTSPLLATADALRRLDPTVEITCLGTPRGLETRVVPEAGYPLELIPPVPMPRRPNADLVKVPARLRGAVKATNQVLDRVRPDVVVGYGGYVSVPAYLAPPPEAAAGGARRPADPTDDLDPRPGREPGGATSLLRSRPRPSHPAGDRWLAGRHPPQPGRVGVRPGAGRRRRPGAARPGQARRRRAGGDGGPLRRARVRRPDGPRLRRRRPGGLPGWSQQRHRGRRDRAPRHLRPAPDRQR